MLVGAPLHINPEADEGRASAPSASLLQTHAGVVYLFHGVPSGLALAPSWQLAGDQPNAALGASLVGTGDLDDDGYADFAIGEPYYDGERADTGRVRLFAGSSTDPVATRTTAGPGRSVGLNVAAGDLNDDGWSDLLVAYQQGTRSRVLLYVNAPNGLPPAPTRDLTSVEYSGFGSALEVARDTNGDGVDDLLVGASGRGRSVSRGTRAVVLR